MQSFGHAFYIQGGNSHRLENCTAEGRMRSTDEMLAETSGPAVDVKFRSVIRNREGEDRVASGYMKSLSEDGFRTYVDVANVVFRRCAATGMRHGFALRNRDGIRVEGCRSLGNEIGFWVGESAVVEDCTANSEYGPVLVVEGCRAAVHLTITPEESPQNVHALAIIQGFDHTITLRSQEGHNRPHPVPLMLGFGSPMMGAGMAPIPEAKAERITLRNETNASLIVSSKARDYTVQTSGPVELNRGTKVVVESLP